VRTIIILAAFLLLTGCATYQPIPEGYTGPVAKITDTYANKEPTKAHYYELQKSNNQ
jgi:uncharacterized lipoprotein YajG